MSSKIDAIADRAITLVESAPEYSIPTKARVPHIKRDIPGMTVTEIAVYMGVSKSYVSQTIRTALLRLRENINLDIVKP